MYKTFGKNIEYKDNLHGVGDAGARLLFKFRSGMHGLNEELGRHRGREGTVIFLIKAPENNNSLLVLAHY